MLKYCYKVLLLFIVAQATFCRIAGAQNVKAQDDSLETFTIDEFYQIILSNHPVVKQAGLLGEVARQEVRLARGSFDPSINAAFDQKEFTDKVYYSRLNTYLSVPTWIPVNPKVGFENNYGPLLNNENYIAGEKQIYAGISVPLGRGLFTDERRTSIRQAELFTDLAAADQVKAINKILLEAAKDYWQWYFAHNQYQLALQGVRLAEDIFSRTKATYQLGELSVLDTVQAKITVQTRRVELQESLLSLQNTKLIVSNYLWDDNSNPVQLFKTAIPYPELEDQLPLPRTTLDSLLGIARNNHPDLARISIRINQAELDRSLAREFLKPKLELNYALLAQPSTELSIDPINDYKLGIDFAFPLLLRKERSKVALAKFKINNLSYQLQQSEREIVNSITATYNELNTISSVLVQQREMVNLYIQLLRSEYLNLENGESDLFKINIQQEKLLQAQSKLLKLITDYHKQKAQLNWAAGVKNLGKEIGK